MASFTRTLDTTDWGKVIMRVKVTINPTRGAIKVECWGFDGKKKFPKMTLTGERLSYRGMLSFARYADNVHYGTSDGAHSVVQALASIKIECGDLLQ